MEPYKKLYKVNTNKMICGVCSGLSEYFNVDATLIRILWVIATLFTALFLGIIAYIACAIIMPNKDDVTRDFYNKNL